MAKAKTMPELNLVTPVLEATNFDYLEDLTDVKYFIEGGFMYVGSLLLVTTDSSVFNSVKRAVSSEPTFQIRESNRSVLFTSTKNDNCGLLILTDSLHAVEGPYVNYSPPERPLELIPGLTQVCYLGQQYVPNRICATVLGKMSQYVRGEVTLDKPVLKVGKLKEFASATENRKCSGRYYCTSDHVMKDFVEGEFLLWGTGLEECSDGKCGVTVAVVELPSGQVVTCPPEHLRFRVGVVK